MNQVDFNDVQYILERGYKPQSFSVGLKGKDGRILPHVTQFNLEDGKSVSVFHVKPIYYETKSGHWRPISEICLYHGNSRIVLNENWRNASPRFIEWLIKRQAVLGSELLLPTPFGEFKTQDYARPSVHLGMTITTVYPDPDPETTTMDGMVTSGYAASWAALRAIGTGDGAGSTSPYGNNCYIVRALRNASGYYVNRTMFLFDTSSISSGDTINSATLSLYGNTFAYVNNSSTSFEIVQSNPASNTDIVAGDIDAFSFTSFASINYSSLSQSAYNDFSLNASGISNVTKAGISKFGGITGLDLNQTTMTSGHDNIFAFKEAESSGTSTDPKLAVDHTSGAVAVSGLMIRGYS